MRPTETVSPSPPSCTLQDARMGGGRVMGVGRIDFEALLERELANKCDDCCLVIGCEVCGPCPVHDGPDTEEEP